MARAVFVPDSWGSLAEANPCHLPAGRPDGGQFCSTTGSLYFEPPRGKLATNPAPGRRTSAIKRFTVDPKVDANHLTALGITDPQTLAARMLGHVQDGERFDVKVRPGFLRMSGPGRLAFTFTGDKGTEMVREFFTDPTTGKLVVEHIWFTVAPEASGSGKAQEIFKASLAAYEQLGVARIELEANADIGAYAWARYGFKALSPDTVKLRARLILKNLQREGVLTADEVRQIAALMEPKDPTMVWRLADARLRVGRERAQQAATWLRTYRRDIPIEPLQRSAERGEINVGHLLLLKNPWHGVFDLADAEQRTRLRQYVGDW